MKFRIPVWIGVAALALGCKLGPVAKVRASKQPLAVGSYATARIVDDSFTTTLAYATEVTSVTLSDSAVARVLAAADGPPELSAYSIPETVFLQALAAGETSLKIDADFSDGSKRSATTTLRAKAIQTVSIAPTCDDKIDLPLRTFVGARYGFGVVMLNGNQPLAGYLPGAMLGEGLECGTSGSEGLMEATYCTWAAPASGGSVTISSPLQSDFSTQLQTYSPADVSEIGADLASGSTNVQTAGNGGGSFPSYVKLAGGRPCQSLAVQVRTLGSNICAGPAGETMWTSETAWTTADTSQTVTYTSVAEGDCQLALGAAGAASYPTIVHVPVRVASAFSTANAADPGAPCANAGATTCMTNFLCVETCKNGIWGPPSSCPKGQVCELLPVGIGGCAASPGCARCR